MDLQGVENIFGNDKRKCTEADLDVLHPIKKVCTASSSTVSPNLPSDVSTSPALDSIESNVTSVKIHHVQERRSVITSTIPYLENQSLSIESSVASQESNVSVCNVNVNPIISSSSTSAALDLEINKFIKGNNETNPALNASSSIDSSMKGDISSDLFIPMDRLDEQRSEIKIPPVEQTPFKLPTAMIPTESQSSKVTCSDSNTDLVSLESQIVSSSDESKDCIVNVPDSSSIDKASILSAGEEEKKDSSNNPLTISSSLKENMDVEKELAKENVLKASQSQYIQPAQSQIIKERSQSLVSEEATESAMISKEISFLAKVSEAQPQSVKIGETEPHPAKISETAVQSVKISEQAPQTLTIEDASQSKISKDVLQSKIGNMPPSKIIEYPSKYKFDESPNESLQVKEKINKDLKLDEIKERLLKSTYDSVLMAPRVVPVVEARMDTVETLNKEMPKQVVPSSIGKDLSNLGTNVTKEEVIKPDLSFVPLAVNSESLDSPMAEIDNEVEQDKKSEISTMEVDSTNFTLIEGSLVNTPCDSGETSPTSTPADSCQVSAAPSPLLKEDPNITSEGLLFDESSIDAKDQEEEIKPVKLSKKKSKKAAAKSRKSKAKSTPILVDEETRMSASGDIAMDEDSQSSVGTSSKKETRRYRCEVICPESTETFTADKVNEYLWPLEGIGEHYFIQEHVSQYLGIMSFKRKYPDLRRRPIESQEKEYLKDLGVVSEMACDLGLTAVRSEDLLDIMFTDFPNKYEELQRVLRERKEKQLKEKGKVDYQVVNLDKSKMQEYSRKAALNASRWNAAFNREKNEERRYAFDLQTFTLHMALNRHSKITPARSKMGSYPVAVLPGQYTDYCKRYSYQELRGMPLQSVLSGPFTAEELAAEMQGIDSDDENAVPTFGRPCPAEIKEEVDLTPVVDPLSAEKQPRCKVCNGGRARNKDGKPEPLIICGTCRTASHPTCIDLTLVMIDKIESYSWQCMDCKTCAQCNDPDDEEKMIFCDMCDRGYHIYCVGLRRVPNGRWHCKECAVCYTCGARSPSGSEHIKNADWQHEFKKDKDNKQLKYACTLCVPCDKYWKRRQFCSVCMKVYRSIPEDGMVRCSGCPKYVHKEVCSILHENERYCNICFKSRNKTALNHSRIIAAAKKKMANGNTIWK